jgi:hypothetical protein
MPRYLLDDGRISHEPPTEYVRCLLCGETVEKDWFDVHMAEECDVVGFEPL